MIMAALSGMRGTEQVPSLDYILAAKTSPQSIVWGDQREVALSKARHGTFGIKISTFQDAHNNETYTLVTKVTAECSIQDHRLRRADRLYVVNGRDITRVATSAEVQSVLAGSHYTYLQLVVSSPLKWRKPKRPPEISRSPDRVVEARREGNAISMSSVSTVNGSSSLDSQNSLEGSLSIASLQLAALAEPQRIVWSANTLKEVLKKNGNDRFGFTCKIKKHENKKTGERDIYYLVKEVNVGPAMGLLQIGDWIRSVNGTPLQSLQDNEHLSCIVNKCSEIYVVFQRPERHLQDNNYSGAQREPVPTVQSRLDRSIENEASIIRHHQNKSSDPCDVNPFLTKPVPVQEDGSVSSDCSWYAPLFPGVKKTPWGKPTSRHFTDSCGSLELTTMLGDKSVNSNNSNDSPRHSVKSKTSFCQSEIGPETPLLRQNSCSTNSQSSEKTKWNNECYRDILAEKCNTGEQFTHFAVRQEPYEIRSGRVPDEPVGHRINVSPLPDNPTTESYRSPNRTKLNRMFSEEVRVSHGKQNNSSSHDLFGNNECSCGNSHPTRQGINISPLVNGILTTPIRKSSSETDLVSCEQICSKKPLAMQINSALSLASRGFLAKVPYMRMFFLGATHCSEATFHLLAKYLGIDNVINIGSDVTITKSIGDSGFEDSPPCPELIKKNDMSCLLKAKYVAQKINLSPKTSLGCWVDEEEKCGPCVNGVATNLIGQFLNSALLMDSHILEIKLSMISDLNMESLWPRALFRKHCLYFVTFDLCEYLSNTEVVKKDLGRKLNEIQTYAALQHKQVFLVTFCNSYIIDDVLNMAMDLNQTFGRVYCDILCFNEATTLPVFVVDKTRDKTCMLQAVTELLTVVQSVPYPFAALDLKAELEGYVHRHGSIISVDQVQLLLKDQNKTSKVVHNILCALHDTGDLIYPGRMPVKTLSSLVLDSSVMVDIELFEKFACCLQLQLQDSSVSDSHCQTFRNTGLLSQSHIYSLLDRLGVGIQESLPFLQLFHLVFSLKDQCYLTPFRETTQELSVEASIVFNQQILYVDFEGYLPSYLPLHLLCQFSRLSSGNSQIHGFNEGFFNVGAFTFHVKFQLEASRVKISARMTSAMTPRDFLIYFQEQLAHFVPINPGLRYRVGPRCPLPDCIHGFHVLDLQSSSIMCGQRSLKTVEGVKQWIQPSR